MKEQTQIESGEPNISDREYLVDAQEAGDIPMLDDSSGRHFETTRTVDND